MRFFHFHVFLFLIVALVLPGSFNQARAQDTGVGQQIDEPGGEAIDVEEVLEVKTATELGPNPQRSYCAREWTEQYARQKAEIEVSTRGDYDEIVVFDCPSCSLEDHFIKPFLESEYRGKTGYMRIQECGFHKAVFEGFRGIHEISFDVPQVFPDPERVRCIADWNEKYQKLDTDMRVLARGEYNEQIVFMCALCANKESFVIPFLRAEYEGGNTAMDKMRSCGFKKVVFTNLTESKKIVKEVR